MSCNTPSIDQTNEAVELSFFFYGFQFSSRLSLICGAWVGCEIIEIRFLTPVPSATNPLNDYKTSSKRLKLSTST